jgi:hypothetical protein
VAVSPRCDRTRGRSGRGVRPRIDRPLCSLHAGEFLRIDVDAESGTSQWLEGLGLTRVGTVAAMAGQAAAARPDLRRLGADHAGDGMPDPAIVRGQRTVRSVSYCTAPFERELVVEEFSGDLRMRI